MNTRKSCIFLQVSHAQNTTGKYHKEMNVFDLCSGSIHSDSVRDKMAQVEKPNNDRTVKETSH